MLHQSLGRGSQEMEELNMSPGASSVQGFEEQ